MAKREESSSEDEIDQMDRERREDLQGRDDFAKRLLDRDKDKTRNIMSKSDKKVSLTHVLCEALHVPDIHTYRVHHVAQIMLLSPLLNARTTP